MYLRSCMRMSGMSVSQKLEPDMMKITSPVLRRGRASNRPYLFDGITTWIHMIRYIVE